MLAYRTLRTQNATGCCKMLRVQESEDLLIPPVTVMIAGFDLGLVEPSG